MTKTPPLSNALISLVLWGVLLSLGLKESVNSIFNILFLILACIYGDWKFLRDTLKKQPVILAGMGLVVLYLLGLTYSENIEEGWRRVQIKLMLVFMPAGLILIWHTLKKKVFEKKAILTSTVFAIACLSWSIIRYLDTGNTHYFYYSDLSIWMMHPNYLSIFTGASLFYLWLKWVKDKAIFSRVVDNILFFFNYAFLTIFLQARTGLAIWILLLVVMTAWRLRGRIFELKFVLPMVGAALILAFAIFYHPSKRANRYTDNIEIKYEPNVDGKDRSLSTRLMIWENCMVCISEKPVLGHGPGDGMNRLKEIYSERKFIRGEENGFNCHNQYLETHVAIGVLGSLLLLLMLYLAIMATRENKHYLLLTMFVLMFFGAMSVESLLERHKGVMIFAVFITHFSLLGQRGTKKLVE
jgi:O-antigen ligase